MRLIPPTRPVTIRVGRIQRLASACPIFATRIIPIAIAVAVSFVAQRAVDAQAVTTAQISSVDRVRLAEARRLMDAVQDSVWPGWSGAPSAVLLVTPDREFLLWHPKPSADFERVGYDSLLATTVFSRARQYSPTLLATFPAVGGVSTVVIGTAEQTGKRSTAWVLTIAHEHFHQLQSSRPEYYPRVAGLDLSRGDETGMWMLNYPFPYAAPAVRAEFDAVALALRAALSDTASVNVARHATTIDNARQRLRTALSAPDHRYLDFQLWQEGIARYTEYAVARFAATRYQPSDAFSALPDAEPFGRVADRLRREIVETESVSLNNERVAFYPVGAALGLWLDRADPAWRQRYFQTMLSLEPLRSSPR